MSNTLVIKGANFSVNALDVVSFDSIPCTGISLNSNSEELTTIGGTATLVATVTPAETTDAIVWSSSDNSVVSVDDGEITALSVGRATITASCGNQTAVCTVDVNVIPNYVVVGAFNPYKAATGIATTNNIDKSGNGTKNGIIAASNVDESVKRIDCYGSTDEGNYRFVPIKLPAGAKRIKLESKMRQSNVLLSMKTRLLWFDSTKSQSPYTSAKCLDGKGSSSWDQSTADTTIIVNVPDNLTGVDSFAVGLEMSDWSLEYNNNYAQYFDVTILPEANS